MLSPIKSISFKPIQVNQKRKAQNTKQNNISNVKLENSIYSKGIAFKGYPLVDNQVSFAETLKRNYFQLPQVKLSDGSMYQLRPDESQLECAKKIYNGDSLVFYIEDDEVKITSTSNLDIKLKDEKKKAIVRKEK